MRLKTVLVLLTVVSTAKAQSEGADQPEGAPAAPAAENQAMDNRRLGELLKLHFHGSPIKGRDGAWQITLPKAPVEAAADDDPKEPPMPGADGHLDPVVIVLTDERADRMRIMMPIRPFDPDQVEDLQLALIALHANYDRALDARYAIQDGVLWSVFIHPLGSLTKADLANAIEQVRTLRTNTGTTYSSSDLLFGGGVEPEEKDTPRPSEDPSAA